MAEKNKDESTTRQVTKGFMGGLMFGFLLYLAVLFLEVAINKTSNYTLVPQYTEFGGFAIGFAGGIIKNL